MLHQLKFLNSVLTKLNNPNTSSNVLNDLEIVRKYLMQPSNMALHIVAKWSSLRKEWDKEHRECSLMGVWSDLVKDKSEHPLKGYELFNYFYSFFHYHSKMVGYFICF